MTKVIHVKQKHINQGSRADGDSCPVALALQDAGYDSVWVDNNAVEFTILSDDPYNYVSLVAPRSVTRFVKKFDKAGKKAVKPFSFKLRVHE